MSLHPGAVASLLQMIALPRSMSWLALIWVSASMLEKALSAFIVDKPYNNKPTGSGAWCLLSAHCPSSSRFAESRASPQLILCVQLSKCQLGKRLLELGPGREKLCTLLGCKHAYSLCLYLFPAIEFGLLLNYRNTGVPNVSHVHGQHQEPLLPLSSAPRELQRYSERKAGSCWVWEEPALSTAAWLGELSCTVQTDSAGLYPYSKGNWSTWPRTEKQL